MNNKLGLQAINPTNLNDIVYDLLRERILNHDFIPGQRLDLGKLEDALQISRTPLKNALTRLEVEGLVEIQPRRGTFVSIISAEKLDEAYKIRSAFELYVALCIFKYLDFGDYTFFNNLEKQMNLLVQGCGENWHDILNEYLELDRELHEHLVRRGGPPKMLQLFQQMNVHAHLFHVTTRYSYQEFQAMHFEHGQIFAAIHAESPERLSAVLFNHLESSRIRTMKCISMQNIE